MPQADSRPVKDKKAGSGSHVWPASKLSSECRRLDAALHALLGRLEVLEAGAISTPSAAPIPARPSGLGVDSFAAWAADAMVAFINSRGADMLGYASMPDNVDMLKFVWMARMICSGATVDEIFAFEQEVEKMKRVAESYEAGRKERVHADIERRQAEAAASAPPTRTEEEQAQVEQEEAAAQQEALEAIFAGRGYETNVERAEKA